MKVAGLVGGIAPESTIDYYRSIIREYRERVGDDSYPRILINSIDLTTMIGLVRAGRLRDLTHCLAREITALARAGAELGALASNTPHIVFDDLRSRSPIPLISIVETACDEAVARGLRRVGLFGTEFTMKGTFYAEAFAARGIAVIPPDADDLRFVNDKYFAELVNGVFLAETRQALAAIAGRMKERHGIEGVVLGGTELPLLLADGDCPGLSLLNTTAVHVKRIVSGMLAG